MEEGRIDRRGMLAASLAALALPSSVGGCAATRKRDELVYVGMQGAQIHAARFDPASGNLTPLGPVAEMPSPTWAVRHQSLPVIYFTEETYGGGSDGGVRAFRIDPATGALNQISNVRSGGIGPVSLWFDKSSMTVLVANYGGTVAALPVGPDGTLQEPDSVCRPVGSGPHSRQTSPHPHDVRLDPSGRFALAPDLGADRIFVIPFDHRTRRLAQLDPAHPRHYGAPPGSGPRHMAFHPNERIAYLICELSAEIHTLAWDPLAPGFTPVDRVAIDPPGAATPKSGAEIRVSPDGRFVYASNRRDHTLIAYAVDAKTGRLSEIQRLSSGGERPWQFALYPDGGWLLVANRDANALRLFAIDRKTGKLNDTGKTLASPKPVFCEFFA